MDWKEVYEPFPEERLREQATRCMDCGIPFCHNGCPLGNLIPEWNDFSRRGQWARRDRPAARDEQLPRVHRPAVPGAVRGGLRARHRRRPGHHQAGRGRPSSTGRGTRACHAGARRPSTPASGWRWSGSGPAGLAAAQQLTRAGHTVTVYERNDRIGGLLRYGIPEFKMEKRVLDRRLEQMRAEGTAFVTELQRRRRSDRRRSCATRTTRWCSAVGSTAGRNLPVPGRELDGVHLAMEYLEPSNRVQEGDLGDLADRRDRQARRDHRRR